MKFAQISFQTKIFTFLRAQHWFLILSLFRDRKDQHPIKNDIQDVNALPLVYS